MLTRLLVAAVVVLAVADQIRGQVVQAGGQGTVPPSAWRPTDKTFTAPASATIPVSATSPLTAPVGAPAGAGAAAAARPVAGGPTPPPAAPSIDPLKRPGLKVTAGSGTLPNEQGQVWREYDITAYTSRVTTTKRPEQAMLDWILRDTGYETWHSEPLAILSATPRTLRVYHTPRVQAVVADLVERFLINEAETRTFSLRVITIENPNWRARAQRLLHPVAVQTPGASAWLMPKEDAAVLLADLQRRNDFREHSSPHLLVHNGQSTVVSALRGRTYVRDVIPRPEVWPGFEAQPGQMEEGFTLEFNPLLAVDRKTLDATIKCDIDQVEKLVPVMLEVPTPMAPRQRGKVEVPQVSHYRFQERFRWPTEQVLLVGMGMVALPVPIDGKSMVPGLPLPLPTSPPRADLLVLVESKGPMAETPGAARAPQQQAGTPAQRF